QDADAADLMQEVFRSLATAAGRFDYDPRRGNFRGWLYTVTRNKIFSFFERTRQQVRGTGDSGAQHRLNEEPDHAPDLSAEWDLAYERRLAAHAMERIRGDFQPATWDAFARTAVDGVSPQEVARQLRMSPGAVYVAKSRVLARLKEEVQRLQQEEEEQVA